MSDAGEHNGEPMDDDILAAEYVLGVLPQGARANAAARVEADPAFATAVARWEESLSGMNESYGETPPPPAIWNRLEASLFPAEAPRERRTPLWSSLKFWRGLSVASMAAAAILAAFVVMRPQVSIAPGAEFVASLSAPDSQAGFVALYGPDGVRVASTGPAAPSDRDYELWVIAGDNAPVSMGVIDRSRPTTAKLPAAYSDPGREKLTLAVTLEPQGGSPTGAPTGPVVAAGPLTKI